MPLARPSRLTPRARAPAPHERLPLKQRRGAYDAVGTPAFKEVAPGATRSGLPRAHGRAHRRRHRRRRRAAADGAASERFAQPLSARAARRPPLPAARAARRRHRRRRRRLPRVRRRRRRPTCRRGRPGGAERTGRAVAAAASAQRPKNPRACRAARACRRRLCHRPPPMTPSRSCRPPPPPPPPPPAADDDDTEQPLPANAFSHRSNRGKPLRSIAMRGLDNARGSRRGGFKASAGWAFKIRGPPGGRAYGRHGESAQHAAPPKRPRPLPARWSLTCIGETRAAPTAARPLAKW